MKMFNWILGKKKNEIKDVKTHDTEDQNNNLKIAKNNIEHETICPYCKTVLKKFPIRKTNCFNCGENIHILKFNNYKEKKLITENEKLIHEAEEKRTSFRTRWLADLQRFGIKEHDFNDRKEQFFKKTGILNNDNDVIWSFFNELVFKNHSNLNQLPMLYYSMALFVHEEGKDNFYLLKEFAISTLHKLELQNLNSDLTIMVEIVSGSNSCDICKKSNGLKMTIADAFKTMPIPCKECTHSIGFCRCFYVAIPMRDEDGMLILKK